MRLNFWKITSLAKQELTLVNFFFFFFFFEWEEYGKAGVNKRCKEQKIRNEREEIGRKKGSKRMLMYKAQTLSRLGQVDFPRYSKVCLYLRVSCGRGKIRRSQGRENRSGRGEMRGLVEEWVNKINKTEGGRREGERARGQSEWKKMMEKPWVVFQRNS